jgi:hypothetical protein
MPIEKKMDWWNGDFFCENYFQNRTFFPNSLFGKKSTEIIIGVLKIFFLKIF